MKCRYSENDVALYVEGDLDGLDAREFEAHLAACHACGELETELRQSQLALKSLRQDTVSAAALAHVRTRVLAEVGGGNVKWGWGRWVYAMAGMGLVAVLCVGLASYLREPEVQQAVKIDPLPPAAAVPRARGTITNTESLADTHKQELHQVRSLTVPLRKADSRHTRQGAAHTEMPEPATPADPPKQIVVKLLTDDPNIVIYWLVDQPGGTL